MAPTTAIAQPTPELQRLNALRKANETRSARSKLKRDLASGRVTAREVLTDVPQYAETMRIFDLLIALPKVGRVKAAKVCTKTGIPVGRPLGSLTSRRREEIIRLLGA